MKVRLFIAFLLMAVIGGFVCQTVQLQEDYYSAVYIQQRENDEISRRTDELDGKQADLEALNTANADALDQQTAEINAQAEAVLPEIDAAKAQTEALNAAVAEKQQELETVKEELSYYLEVYDALEEGLEKVKGYIAGN